MNLIERLEQFTGPALWHNGVTLHYPELLKQAKKQLQQWGPERQLIALRAYHDPSTIIIYLAALMGRHPIILLNPKLDSRTEKTLLTCYQPNWCYLQGRLTGEHRHQSVHALADDLAVMLTTSGSTGGVKLVQLSLTNLSANASSIAEYLHMDAHSRVLSALPLAYSYGLSLLNSHLWVGGSMVLCESDPLSREFWQILREQRVTQLAGVPYSYQVYEQLRIRRSEWPDLEVLTQAGGKLDPHLAEKFANWASWQGKDFFIMYGQTEATARIAYLPVSQALCRPDSIGIAIPGGELMIVDEQGQPVKGQRTGELVYRGDNVMLGYAQSLDDLAHPARPDYLKTGDLGYCDEEGFFYVTGRLKRMLKLAGVRTALDSLESAMAAQGVPATCCGEDNALCIAVLNEQQVHKVEEYLRQELNLHPSLFHVAVLRELPRTANDKLNYTQLAQQVLQASH